MSSKKKVAPVIGTIFSSDSSDEDNIPQRTQRTQRTQRRSFTTDASESDLPKPKPISLRVSIGGSDAKSGSESSSATQRRHQSSIVVPESSCPDGYSPIDKTRIGTVKHNTMIQYETNAGKLVKPKYFKKCDLIAGTIIVGFYPHNKRNYSESINNIKTFYIARGISGGVDALKETIEVPNDQWKTIRRDMIISYEKEDHEYVYRAKFNSFMKGADGSTRMSLTSERGFNYIANPSKIVKIFRHLTGNDKTLTFILEALRKLEARVRQLEANQKKKSI